VTQARKAKVAPAHGLSKGQVIFAVVILVALLFSKNVYQASLGSYYTFYLIEKFHLSVQTAQLYLFAFFIGIVAGILLGGWVGDRVGRIPVMWFSILGALPFALLLPHANLFWTGVLAVMVAMIIASAFSAILVYAQELLPGRVGLVAGIFYGFSFGLGGLGAAALGKLADVTSIDAVYQLTPFLLCLGLLTALLPRLPGEPKNAH
jgi:FSR family fosmidomycin resistance protein-like MFS transporter